MRPLRRRERGVSREGDGFPFWAGGGNPRGDGDRRSKSVLWPSRSSGRSAGISRRWTGSSRTPDRTCAATAEADQRPIPELQGNSHPNVCHRVNGSVAPSSLLPGGWIQSSDSADSGRLAQLGERFPYKEEVGGSSPSAPTYGLPAYRQEAGERVTPFRGVPLPRPPLRARRGHRQPARGSTPSDL